MVLGDILTCTIFITPHVQRKTTWAIPVCPLTAQYILNDILCNKGVYTNGYSIWVRPLCVPENGDVWECYTGVLGILRKLKCEHLYAFHRCYNINSQWHGEMDDHVVMWRSEWGWRGSLLFWHHIWDANASQCLFRKSGKSVQASVVRKPYFLSFQDSLHWKFFTLYNSNI